MGTQYHVENLSRNILVQNISDSETPVTPFDRSPDVSSDITFPSLSSSITTPSMVSPTDDTDEDIRIPFLTEQQFNITFGIYAFGKEKSITEKTICSDIEKTKSHSSRGRGRPSVKLDEIYHDYDHYNYGIGFLGFGNCAFPSIDTFAKVLEDSEYGRKKEQMKLLLNGKHARIRSSYKFIFSPTNVKGTSAYRSKTSEMLHIVAGECSEVYKNLMMKLLEKCTTLEQYQLIHWSKVLQPKNQLYEIKGFGLKLWPIFSYSSNIKYCGSMVVQVSPQLDFAVVTDESLLEIIKKNYKTMGVPVGMKGKLIMSAFSKDILVIEKIHMDRNTFGMFDPYGHGLNITYGDYYTTKYGLGWKCYKIWQPIVECKKFINSNESNPSMFHLPEFCFSYGIPRNIRLNPKFVVALENAYQICYDNSKELLQIFIHTMEQSNTVQREMELWGIQFNKEGSGNGNN